MFRVLIVLLGIFSFAYSFELDVHAKSALLMNAESGKILFEKNANDKSFPASLTKVATALYVLEKKELDFFSTHTPSSEALRVVMAGEKHGNLSLHPQHILEHDGVFMGIKRGETMPIWCLLYGCLIASCNDASNALAEVAAGSVGRFVQELNQYLSSIGCETTHYVNPHGLHHPEHFTTAYDLAKMAQKGLKNPHFKQIMQITSFDTPETNKQKERFFKQTNRLITPGKYHYPYAIGMKTGYTSKAQNNMIAVAEKEGRCLIAVVLGCPHREHKYQDAIALFEKAFSEKKQSKEIFPAGRVFLKQLKHASSSLQAELLQEVSVSYYPSEEGHLQAFVEWKELTLPVHKGQEVGKICIKEDQKIVLEKPIYATEKVSYSFWGYLKSFFV